LTRKHKYIQSSKVAASISTQLSDDFYFFPHQHHSEAPIAI
jgi:hypothetical protein